METVPSGKKINLRIKHYTYIPHLLDELIPETHVYVDYVKEGLFKIPTATVIKKTDDDFKWLYD